MRLDFEDCCGITVQASGSVGTINKSPLAPFSSEHLLVTPCVTYAASEGKRISAVSLACATR